MNGDLRREGTIPRALSGGGRTAVAANPETYHNHVRKAAGIKKLPVPNL
jgi:hypothetical protein